MSNAGDQQATASVELRLRALLTHLGQPAAGDAGHLLEALMDLLATDPSDRLSWQLLLGCTGELPLAEDVARVRRAADAGTPADLRHVVLDLVAAAGHGQPHGIEVARGRVLFDAGHSALHSRHTGIQRVVREVLHRWTQEHPSLDVVVWTADFKALRTPNRGEFDRATRRTTANDHRPRSGDAPQRRVMPLDCTIVLAELPNEHERLQRLRALAMHSGCRVVVLGYDCIPMFGAEYVSPAESERFAAYLSVVKHADRVVAISEASGQEFRGFASTLPVQGLSGPEVRVCRLPGQVVHSPPPTPRLSKRPHVLCLGTIEPRKNQAAVLHAAEVLWREGLDFELAFAGISTGEGQPVVDAISSAAARGRPVRHLSGLGDRDLGELIDSAAFTVFVSLYEGYGLPVAESLAHGIPVVCSAFGSVREVAAGGGALLVDPADDQEIVAGFRRLLTDDALRRQLGDEARGRAQRSWDDYSAELWAQFGLHEAVH